MTPPPAVPCRDDPVGDGGWLDAGCRLVQDGGVHDAAGLATQARDLVHHLAGAHRVAAVAATPLRVAVAVLAARTLGRELSLLRGDSLPTGVDALVGADGMVTRFPGDRPPVATGFSLVLESSGTTGTPKRLRHDFDRLTARVQAGRGRGSVWLATFDPGGYAGLQVLLTVLRGGGTLVAGPVRDVPALADLAARHAVTHISATPSFWRAFLMTGVQPPLKALTLGGEAADQALLDRLAAAFPGAAVRHIYASTEAGALFAVADGRAGFPAAWLETGVEGTDLAVRDGVLWVRGPRLATALADGRGVTDASGWYVTGDRVAVAGDRVLFQGREDGMVNVGGVKVMPDAVEALILAVPGVADAAVRVRSSPITGQLLTAQLVAAPGQDVDVLRPHVVAALAGLPAAARPRRLEFVSTLELSPSGKKKRVQE
ncbi:AMP-binding protein [Nitrospirillum iridis]|uniref:Long-chain-fatty-acid--CoA ligase n=1 Tax=Nitrospirillum iridis TaxID=765888 RepID=A0A7X0EEL9_9PROT|nr:AMP-binding protein [Nitrospirillum iridis]MBB6252196.1 acyl-coenzyme A synthetase/AMP-(fatty) acid ligase [Nitrospirillum iridis]